MSLLSVHILKLIATQHLVEFVRQCDRRDINREQYYARFFSRFGSDVYTRW